MWMARIVVVVSWWFGAVYNKKSWEWWESFKCKIWPLTDYYRYRLIPILIPTIHSFVCLYYLNYFIYLSLLSMRTGIHTWHCTLCRKADRNILLEKRCENWSLLEFVFRFTSMSIVSYITQTCESISIFNLIRTKT